ncbi:MAG: hypothetical protein IT431_15870 [Phycisphaerales bacterium]|nr:hypothetical protein [Phycisphaerales bacterium]
MTSQNAIIPDQTDAGSPDADEPANERADEPTSPGGEGAPAAPGPGDKRPPSPHRKPPRRERRSLFVRLEAFVSRLSTRNNFWHRVCSMIWLPYAFHSGIRMRKLDDETFHAELPFRRFNRNWYNAMAGAALLGNSEIAGGSYVFGYCGGDYTVVCKNLEYKFMRPCLGPAIYRIKPREDIEALVAGGGEFNATLDMEVVQAITTPGSKERRVGKCVATFHITPKGHQRIRGRLK